MNSVCKHCNLELDEYDVLQSLSLNKLYAHYTQQQLKEKARMLGWTPDNDKCFKKDIIIQFDDKPQIEICPECKVIFPRDPAIQTSFYKSTVGGILDSVARST